MKLPPRINDISTDLENPPAIEGRGKLPKRFKRIIRDKYPNVKPLELEAPAEDVFQAALELSQRMSGWTVKRTDEEQMEIQGVAVTPLLRFKDDFVIRIQGNGDNTRIDMRSKSRMGQSDLGANAKRIREFFDLLEARVAEGG